MSDNDVAQHALGEVLYDLHAPIGKSILTALGLSKATATGIPHAIGAALDDYKRRAPSQLVIEQPT